MKDSKEKMGFYCYPQIKMSSIHEMVAFRIGTHYNKEFCSSLKTNLSLQSLYFTLLCDAITDAIALLLLWLPPTKASVQKHSQLGSLLDFGLVVKNIYLASTSIKLSYTQNTSHF